MNHVRAVPAGLDIPVDEDGHITEAWAQEYMPITFDRIKVPSFEGLFAYAQLYQHAIDTLVDIEALLVHGRGIDRARITLIDHARNNRVFDRAPAWLFRVSEIPVVAPYGVGLFAFFWPRGAAMGHRIPRITMSRAYALSLQWDIEADVEPFEAQTVLLARVWTQAELDRAHGRQPR